MRDLVKGSWSLPAADEEQCEQQSAKRPSRHRLRRFVAVAFLVLLVLYGFRYLSEVKSSPPGVSIEYEQHGVLGMLSHGVWRARVMIEQFRERAQASVPNADLMVLAKMACCVVGAAVFLRGPRRS